MQLIYPTLVLRHRKENLKKCSLRGLESRKDFHFFTYPRDCLPDLRNYILLAINAPPLTANDQKMGLLLIDGTWRYAEVMLRQTIKSSPIPIVCRSIPPIYRTAYPRRQNDCPNPELGLASVEALFAAYHILGWDTQGLLDHYYWKSQFLELNKGS